jgi:hypothetical protein
MAGPISARPISGQAVSGDADDPAAQAGKFKRKFRGPMVGGRYEEVPEEAPAVAAEPEPVPCPNYDSLPPDERAVVDRLIVATRMQLTRGIA